MIILFYMANKFDSWNFKTITKSFFKYFSFFEGSILSSKNYNTSLELVNKNTSFENNEINFGKT